LHDRLILATFCPSARQSQQKTRKLVQLAVRLPAREGKAMKLANCRSARPWIATLALLTGYAAVPAHAITVTASSQLFINGLSSESSSDVGELSAFAAVSGSSAFSRNDGVLAVSAGGGIAATSFGFPGPSGAESYEAVATWESVITNNTAAAIDYRFLFNVVSPSLGTPGSADDFAGLGIDILLDGSSIWSAYARIDGCNLEYDNMGGAPFVFGCNADFGSFDAGVSLGSYAPGQSFTLTYLMTAFADNALPFGSAYAAIGDPFFPEGTGAAVVPLPGAIWLYLAALAVVGMVRGRRLS